MVGSASSNCSEFQVRKGAQRSRLLSQTQSDLNPWTCWPGSLNLCVQQSRAMFLRLRLRISIAGRKSLRFLAHSLAIAMSLCEYRPKIALSLWSWGPVSARVLVAAPGKPLCACPCLGLCQRVWRPLVAILYGIM